MRFTVGLSLLFLVGLAVICQSELSPRRRKTSDELELVVQDGVRDPTHTPHDSPSAYATTANHDAAVKSGSNDDDDDDNDDDDAAAVQTVTGDQSRSEKQAAVAVDEAVRQREAAGKKGGKSAASIPEFMPDHRWWDLEARRRRIPLPGDGGDGGASSTIDGAALADMIENDPFKARAFLLEKSKTDASAWYYLGELSELGYDYLEADLAAALGYYEKGAAAGCAKSQAALAVLHATGKLPGGGADKARSVLHFSFAALGGDLTAAHVLGYKYLHGEDVPQDCDKAFVNLLRVSEAQVRRFIVAGHYSNTEHVRLSVAPRKDSESSSEDIYQYYNDASEAGDPQAQLVLGTLFYKGSHHGIPRDYPSARHYFSLAAEQNHADAAAHLGCMAYRGQGAADGRPDVELAHEWLSRAIELADSGVAHNCLGEMHARGLLADSTKNDDEVAMQHFLKAAAHQVAEGQFNAAQYYLYGWAGHAPNLNKAVDLLTQASNLGHPFALHQVALLHYYGIDTRGTCSTAAKILRRAGQIGELHGSLLSEAHLQHLLGNADRAVGLYERAALMGFVVGQINAAFLYDKGYVQVVAERQAQEALALFYYELAAKQQNAHAYLRLGDYHYYGLAGLPVDAAKAVVYYRHASDMHQAQASFNMGYMHEHGVGVPQDFYLAKRYYDLSLTLNPNSWLAWSIAMPALAARYVVHNGLPTHDILESLNIWAVESIAFHLDTVLIIFLTLVLLFALAIRYALTLG